MAVVNLASWWLIIIIILYCHELLSVVYGFANAVEKISFAVSYRRKEEYRFLSCNLDYF